MTKPLSQQLSDIKAKFDEKCKICRIALEEEKDILWQKILRLEEEKRANTFNIPIWSWIWKNIKVVLNLILPTKLKW